MKTSEAKTRNGGDPKQFLEAKQEAESVKTDRIWECPWCQKWQPTRVKQQWTGEGDKGFYKKIPIFNCKYCKKGGNGPEVEYRNFSQ